MHFQTFAFVLTLGSLCANGAKILGIFSYPSKSHHIIGEALLKALAAKGHEVTMMSCYASKAAGGNYKEILLDNIGEHRAINTANIFIKMHGMSMYERLTSVRNEIQKLDKMFLDHPTLAKFLNSNQTFDLVIQNWFFNAATLGVAHHLGAPVIALSTLGSTIFLNRITGNTGPYSYVPNIFLSLPSEMNFMQRVANTVGTLTSELFEYLDLKLHEHHLQKYFPRAPPLQQLLENVSLVLSNSHFSIEGAKPYLPGIIPVGGLHIEDSNGQSLSSELKKFLDDSAEGVLYFSFGSNIAPGSLPKDKIEGIIEGFSKIPLNVLWKFDGPFKNLPKNVKASKWFPQGDVLSHPNTKVFVTHGGLLSTTESIYHGVPIIGVPFFGDQHYNIIDAASKGYAVKLNLEDISAETLTAAVNEILTNPKYNEKVRMRSKALRDQPLQPIDSAVFWTEYVLRNPGAPLLKSHAMKLHWYQYFLVDVVAFLICILMLVLFVSYLTLKFVFRLFYLSSVTFPKKHKTM